MADVTINPADVVPPTANTTSHLTQFSIIAGEAIDAGEIVCMLESDGKYYLADADDTNKQNVKGIAGNNAAVAGQRIDIITASPALVVGTHGVAVGTPLFASETPGKLCPYADLTAGAKPVLVAFAQSATALQIVLAPCSEVLP